ncbi:RNA-binding protein 42 [Ataeniobius toweri]|uniref:RNA-binding protein 42 n=1 Tax=Ataeniobius toweri TaxID=208326 RepID=A0ABU7CI73_9TELE|nr:RNA-binding protein 42 [Ataeniobius toweri]
MALFEQEVLGGSVPISGSPPFIEPIPVALAVPAVPIVRPIIGTNTYRQVQQTLEARAASFVGPPPPAFVGPACLTGRRIGGAYLERQKIAGKLFLHTAIPGRA